MDALVHVANVLLLISYSLKDILWLRALNVVASAFFIAYFIGQPQALWVLVGWNILFMAVNIFQIVRLWRERQPVVLPPQLARLHAMTFSQLSARDFAALMALAAWSRPEPDEQLVCCGERLDHMMFIADGSVEVRPPGHVEGDRIALHAGQFIGEMSYLTGQPPGARVVAGAEATLVSWHRERLRDFLSHHEPVRAALQVIIGHDLVRKLRAVG